MAEYTIDDLAADLRAKYSAEDKKDLLKKGQAMPPSSEGGEPGYPIGDQEDLEKAIKAVGRGNADHDAIRKHIIDCAETLKLTKLIPDNWNADGSEKTEPEAKSAEELAAEERTAGSDDGADEPAEGTKQCPECKGKGTILAGNRTCPVCKGTKTVASDYEAKSQRAVESEPSLVTPQRRSKKPRQRSGPPIGQEFRVHAVEGLEVRSAKDNSDIIEIVGKPIMYNQAYRVADVFGDFQETMQPGVAAKILQTADTRFLFNHGGMPLARTSAGTMTLEDSPTSLNFVAGLDARQQLSNDLAIAIERGDISQMSVGFIVGQDTWSDDMQERSITDLKELLDVSAVTYPCSTTTTIDIARRMWDNIPVESQARVRRMWSVAAELRGGKVLSADNANKLTTALTALHAVATSAGVSSHPEEDEVDVDDVDGNTPTNSNTDDGTALSPGTDPVSASDGAGSRSAEPVIETEVETPTLEITPTIIHIGRSDPETKEERKHLRAVLGLVLDVRALDDDQLVEFLASLTDEQRQELEATEERAGEMSYNDIQRAVENELGEQLGDSDGDSDFWVQDVGDGWAVFQSYIDPPGQGTYRVTYTVGDAGEIKFTSDPSEVNRITTYEPVPADEDDDAPLLTGRSAMQLELDLMLMGQPTQRSGFEPVPYHKDADETVTCPKCGKADDDDAKYCDQCGFKLEGADDVEVAA